jgi:molybdopterin synthase sulfur carrier subunit
MEMIRVTLPYQLQVLAKAGDEVELEVQPPITIAAVLDALETRYPMLRGAILDHQTRKRRPLIRFFACSRDFSLDPLETALPEEVASGRETFFIVGAIAGG